MINFSKKTDLKSVLLQEKNVVNYYNQFESNIKESLETYIDEFKDVSFDNEVLKTMLLNNFASAVIQVDNNIQNIQSLVNIIEILEKQDEVTQTDIDTYNKLASKVDNDIELLQNFLCQTISSFDNVPINGKKKTITTLNNCKEQLLKKIDVSEIEKASEEKVTKQSAKSATKTIKKKMDVSSSDLLCFFPKSKSDSLVISTVQENYKISFTDEVANIYIEDEDFNLSLKTAGVQISNSNTNNILFVSHTDSKYTIITNSQIELPRFIQVSKIAKNDDFLEVEITNQALGLNIKNSIINFENEAEVEEQVVQKTTKATSNKKIDDIFGHLDNLHTLENSEPKNIEEPKEVEKSKIYQPIPTKEVAETVDNTNIKIQPAEDEVKDNNTLIISDSNQNVVLPYKVIDFYL